MRKTSSDTTPYFLGRYHVIRRTALVSAAAGTLVLIPTAAFAYDAPGFASTVSDPTPAAGTAIVLTVDGDSDIANKEVLLTVTSTPASLPNSAIEIAGTATKVKVADANGYVDFDVTLKEAGTYSAVATVDGATVSTFELPVVTAAAASATKAATADGALAATGFDGAGLAAGAGALVVAGAGAVLIAKRRQSAAI
jgi:hypothetical protein